MLSPWQKIIQMGFVSRDVRATMDAMTRNLNVGPWFLRERGSFTRQLYRGRPTPMSLAVGMGYCAGGAMQYEVIQQLDDAPSIFTAGMKSPAGAFHHFGIGTSQFDRSFEDYNARGYELLFEADVPTGARVAYFDTLGDMPGLVELIETNDDLVTMFDTFQAASVGWTGDNPIRLRQPVADPSA